MHGKNPGRIVSKCMHPRGAQNKRLISNTGRVVIPATDLSIFSHRYCHPTTLRSGVGDLYGSSWYIGPTPEKHYLEVVWKEL